MQLLAFRVSNEEVRRSLLIEIKRDGSELSDATIVIQMTRNLASACIRMA